MSLPTRMPWETAQDRWKSQLDPVISNPLNGVNILQNVTLLSGTNVINHKLGHTLQGWFITRQNALSSIYDAQSSNQTPSLTLVLVASAPVTVNIGVF